jgi:hypothetical protein
MVKHTMKKNVFPNNKEKPQERHPDDEIFSLPDNCIICPLQ